MKGAPPLDVGSRHSAAPFRGEAAREIIRAAGAHPPAGPRDEPSWSSEFERIRWFPLPDEALARLTG